MCVAVNLRDPNVPGSWGECPFLHLTGFACPGCGTLRAIHALGHGDPATAMSRNPLLLIAAPLLVLAWVLSVRRAWTGEPARRRLPMWLYHLIPVGVALFWVMRNLPGFGFLGPGG